MLRPPKIEDLKYLREHLREADKAEIRALGETPVSALFDGMLLSDPCVIAEDREGLPAVIMGVVPDEYPLGHVWLLGTPAIDEEPMRFLRQSRPILQQLHRTRPLLANYVHAENKVHIRWLRWLGFSFLSQHTRNDHQFHHFARLEHVRTDCDGRSHVRAGCSAGSDRLHGATGAV